MKSPHLDFRRLISLICAMALLWPVIGSWAADAPRPAALLSAPQAKNASAPSPDTGRGVQASLDQRELRAQLAPRRFTSLAAEIGAKISRLPIPEGGVFRKGQLLISFDCSLQQAQLNKAKASLGAAEKTWGANKRLSELNSIGSVELQVSEAEVMKSRAEVALMNTMIGKCSIEAPFDGRVAEQKLREQQFAQAGQAILDIIDDSVLEIEFLVPSRWLAWVKPGYPMQVHIDETGKTYPASIRRVGARVDPVSQSVKLFAAIDGKFPDLIAGMSGRIDLKAPPGK